MDGADRSSRKTVYSILILLLLVVVPETIETVAAYSVHFTDSGGSRIVLSRQPEKVVSLVPGITRIIFALGAGEAVKGLTWHDTFSPETARSEVVGGFSSPSLERIETLQPDLIFVSSLHREARERFAKGSCWLVELRCGSIEDIVRNIALLGEIFEKREKAAELIGKIRGELQLVSRKLEKIPAGQRKRVLRLMGRDRVMTPGEDSFQSDFIRAAGGIPPELGKHGEAVEMSLEEWKRFDPQVIYGCGGDRETADKLLTRPGWKDVEAVREGRIYYFPCELTCQPSSSSADFVAWLASVIYEEPFSIARNQVLEEKRTGFKPVELPLDYVKSARVVESIISDFPNKTLVVDFKKPMRILSTLEGERRGITCVGNHGSPPPCWSIGHRRGFEEGRNRICKILGKPRESSSFLLTGASMDNLVLREARFKDMSAHVLVTAGVRGNAVRMSSDEGRYYEPGTINIIVMTNRKLSPRATARAVISATEAKTAALQDLDVRSGGNPLAWQATGTGTDEMIVVEGSGTRLDSTGGHCKMGELIARAVYDGVKEAVFRQNGIATPRNLLGRLQERGVSPPDLLRQCSCLESANEPRSRHVLGMLEEILMHPRYAAFMESALALSDARERGQIGNTHSFELWARSIADDIAGRPVLEWKELTTNHDLPVILKISLDALLNGLSEKLKEAPRELRSRKSAREPFIALDSAWLPTEGSGCHA
jgi:ABC-type Fe3+-hydroxamate transport system substrate-binding protein/adenosylcobinamide amidohydrolase